MRPILVNILVLFTPTSKHQTIWLQTLICQFEFRYPLELPAVKNIPYYKRTYASTWQNQFIQKFEKTALPHSWELMGQFLQIFGWIDFVKYVL